MGRRNVEFVNRLGPSSLAMRVHERGVGETRSCGTVSIPGGQVTVTIEAADSTLTGPAVLVARGELSDTWWTSL